MDQCLYRCALTKFNDASVVNSANDDLWRGLEMCKVEIKHPLIHVYFGRHLIMASRATVQSTVFQDLLVCGMWMQLNKMLKVIHVCPRQKGVLHPASVTPGRALVFFF